MQASNITQAQTIGEVLDIQKRKRDAMEFTQDEIYNKLVAKLGDKAPEIITSAKLALRQAHDIELEDDTKKRSWQDELKQDLFALFLAVGLGASLFMSGWRIIWGLSAGMPIWFLLFACATVIVETLSEAIMVFRFSLMNELEERNEPKPSGKWGWVKLVPRYFSLMGVLRLISLLIFGRTYSVLHYLLIYLLFMGALFNLDYELHFVGSSEKIKEIAFAMLPVLSIAVLSHYLGERVKEAKRSATLSGDMFTRLWKIERLERIINVLEASSKKYAQDALNYVNHLSQDFPVSAVSSSFPYSEMQQAGNMAQGAGFLRNYNPSQAENFSHIGKAESGKDGKLAQQIAQVLEVYPNILSESAQHDKVAQVLGYAGAGRPTKRVLDAIKGLAQEERE